jgi:hypothetical protein
MSSHRRYLQIIILTAFLTSITAAQDPKPAHDCKWKYAGSSRKEVKNGLGPQRGSPCISYRRPAVSAFSPSW